MKEKMWLIIGIIFAAGVVAGMLMRILAADGNFDSLATLTAAEVVATDKQYTLEILGTTGAGDSIIVMGAEVKVIRLS